MIYHVKELADNMLENIFKDEKLESLSEIEQERCIYNYLTDNIEFDFELLEKKKQRQFKEIPNPAEQVINVFTKYKGYSSAISQAYRILLGRLNIPAMAVIGYDDGNIHQFVLVKRGENWSFDDVSLGIIFSSKKEKYFNYDDLEIKKQTVLGILPNEAYDPLFDLPVCEQSYNLEESNICAGLYKLPSNIRNSRGSQKTIR